MEILIEYSTPWIFWNADCNPRCHVKCGLIFKDNYIFINF